MAGQVWVNSADGGYLYSDQLSSLLRMAVQPAVRFRQFCDAQDGTEKQLKTGDRFNWDVFSDVQDGGGALDESMQVPTTKFTITQGQLTVSEYGNSVPYTGKLDNLSKVSVSAIINKVLGNDCAKTLDGYAHNQFRATTLKVGPTSGNNATAVTVTTTGTLGITNAIAMRSAHIKAIADAMKERNIPSYQGNDYFCIAWPTTLRTVKNDLEAIHSYVDAGFRIIMAGEIGRYEGVRFVEQTNVAKGGAEDSTTYNFRTADVWNGALSDWAYFFGEDTVAEGIVIPEEMRGKIPTDYGRSRGVMWYYLGGFGIVHGGANNANSRIMKWDSAA